MFTLEKTSHWAQIVSGIVAIIMLVLYVQATPAGRWGYTFDSNMTIYLLPAFVGLCIVLAALLHFLAARNKKLSPSTSTTDVSNLVAHRQTVDKLNECESMVKHWKAEVGREQLMRKEQVEIRDQRIAELNEWLISAKEKLRSAENKLSEFTTPRARLKITRGRYWTEHPETGEMHERDVTEILDGMVLDEKLVLSELYQLIFPEPLKHVRKKLTVDYSHGIRQFSVTVPESTKLTLPFPYDDIPFPR